MGEEVNSVIVEDANTVAYLVLKGYIAIPFIKTEAQNGSSSRVAWDVQGSQRSIDLEMRMFYANEKVGIRDYVRILKDVRASMYAVKLSHNQLKERED